MMKSSSGYRGKEALRQDHELSSLQRKKSTNATLATTLKPPRKCSSSTSSTQIIIGDAQEIAYSSLGAPLRSSSSATYNKYKRTKQTADDFTEQSSTHHRQRYKNQSNVLNNNINNHFSVQKSSQRQQGRSRNNNLRRKRKGSNTQQYQFTSLVIRLVILSSLVYFILSYAISIIYNLVSFIFGFFHIITTSGASSRMSSTSAHSDSIFVQNIEEIQHALELATTEFDIIQQTASQSLSSSKLVQSVRGEEKTGYFEQIVHPSDKTTKLSVPKLYGTTISYSNNNGGDVQKTFRQLTSGKLLTPELAGMIGNGASQTASSERTIFVSIISKNDSKCSQTVTNLLRSASNPERIHVAVVDRITNQLSRGYWPCDAPTKPCDSNPDQMLCIYNNNVDVYEYNAELDTGAIFARHTGMRMYRGEYYVLQVGLDAGIVFSYGWDEDLIGQHEATNNEMAVITTYLSETKVHDDGSDNNNNRPVHPTPERYTICHSSYNGEGRERHLEHRLSDQVEQSAPPSRIDSPMLQPFWSSELSFARAHFVMQVPYDPQLCGLDAQDEEVSMALRAFSSGYDFYTPTHSVIFRRKRTDNYNSYSNSSIGLCKERAKKKSRKRLYSLIGLDNNEDAIPQEYGLGAVREVSKFFTLFGIHPVEKITEHRLCEFVLTGNMHDEFAPHLRSDGMGIDYNEVSFRFHELISIHKDIH